MNESKHEFCAGFHLGPDTADVTTKGQLTLAVMARRTVLTILDPYVKQESGHSRTVIMTAKETLAVANVLHHMLALSAVHSSKAISFTTDLRIVEKDMPMTLHLSLGEAAFYIAATNEKDTAATEKIQVKLTAAETSALTNTLRLYAELIDTEIAVSEGVAESVAEAA